MKPIISPWWFYFFDVLDVADTITAIAGICVILLIFCLLDSKWSPIAATIGAVCLIITVAIPSKTTMYQMAAATLVTPTNIEAVGNTAEDIMDYIIDSVDVLIEDGTTEIEAE